MLYKFPIGIFGTKRYIKQKTGLLKQIKKKKKKTGNWTQPK